MTQKSTVYQEDIERALRQVGVGAGDVVFFHSSLSSMGYVVGGAETVIRAFLSVIDPTRGTLVLPTLCQKARERRFEVWDIHRSPSDVGRITEVGRLWPGAVRSDHATHSVAAIGAQAHEITSGHATAYGRPSPWGPAAFGFGSPWERLYQMDAHYLFLGTTTSCNTIGHFAQAEFVRQLLEGAGRARPALEARVRGWNREGVWPHFGFAVVEEWLKAKGALRMVPIGDTLLRATRARVNVDTILEHLATEGDRFLPPDFLAWRQEALQAAWCNSTEKGKAG